MTSPSLIMTSSSAAGGALCILILSIVAIESAEERVEPRTQEYATLATDLGQIRGMVKHARNGAEYEAYLGIPFAQPPIGDLRWEPPQPPEKWNGVLDATKQASLCFQDKVNEPSEYWGSEDCLYLNVFTPRQPKSSDKKKHTIVWIHGGAFIFGGIDYYGADYIMEFDDVILVTIQYRLNAFGFLSTEDKSLPGNYGSLDQVQALQWIHDHIRSFGGDPEQVTIFGMSAGGASVEYLTLSPLTKHLYKNSISLSGSSLCWWANIPHPRNQALTLAKHFNCPIDKGGAELVECLKKVHGNKLMAAQKELYFDWHHNLTEREPMNLFSPRSDPEREHPFLPHHPYYMLMHGDFNPMPHMMGYTDKEGIWRANQLLPDQTDNNGPVWADFLDSYDKVAPMAFGLLDGQVEDAHKVTDEVTKFYGLDEDLREVHLTDEKVHNVIDALSDTMFNYPIDAAIKLRAKHKDVMDTYFYMLTYPGKLTLANMANDGTYRRPKWEPLKLTSHGSDMLLIFPMFEFYPSMPEADVQVSRNLIRLIIDFGKADGSPVEGWNELDLDDPSYLLMDSKDFKVKKGMPMQDRMDFWNSLPSVYWRYSSKGPYRIKDEL